MATVYNGTVRGISPEVYETDYIDSLQKCADKLDIDRLRARYITAELLLEQTRWERDVLQQVVREHAPGHHVMPDAST